MSLPRNLANKQERSLELVFILAQKTMIPFNTNCFGQLYQEYQGYQQNIPSLETHVRVLSDGKQRRIDTAKS